eukprot:4658571-Alexandrium_andersonii.AAC.1
MPRGTTHPRATRHHERTESEHAERGPERHESVTKRASQDAPAEGHRWRRGSPNPHVALPPRWQRCVRAAT